MRERDCLATLSSADCILVNDNDELAYRAKLLMVRMCGIIIPRQFINPILDELFHAIQSSPVRRISHDPLLVLTRLSQSWKVRLKILPLVQGTSDCGLLCHGVDRLCAVFYFRQSFLISEIKTVEMVEVRAAASSLVPSINSCFPKVVCRCLDDEVVEVREMAATYVCPSTWL